MSAHLLRLIDEDEQQSRDKAHALDVADTRVLGRARPQEGGQMRGPIAVPEVGRAPERPLDVFTNLRLERRVITSLHEQLC